MYYRGTGDKDEVTGTVAFAGHRNANGRLVAEHRYRLECWYKGDPSAAPPAPMGLTILDPGAAENKRFALFFLGIDTARRLRYTATNRNNPPTVIADAVGPSIPIDGRWHFIGIDLSVDTAPPVTVTTARTPYSDIYALTAEVRAYVPFAELQVTAGLGDGLRWLNELPFTPAAVLDPSTLDLDAVTERAAREAWALLKEIAAAEQAVCAFDNRASSATAPAPGAPARASRRRCAR